MGSDLVKRLTLLLTVLAVLVGPVADASAMAHLDVSARDACPSAPRAQRLAPCNSFAPGTDVLMADGTTRPIEEVELGDFVWSADPATGDSGPRKVTRLITRHGDKKLVDIGVGGVVVTATDHHPVWVSGDGLWVDAEDLQPGDLVLDQNGFNVLVEDIEIRRVMNQTVHNLTVDDIPTFFVVAGDEAFLTHNDSCPFVDGAWASVDDALDAGQQFVGQGAQEWAPGVFRATTPNPDGSYNVFRMTNRDLSTQHAPAPHVNFEVHVPNGRGGFTTTENTHVFLSDFP